MQDFVLVVCVLVVLAFTNFLSSVHGFEKGHEKATAEICETKKVVCKVPDIEIKIP